jgi:hypothetical protein
MRKAKARSVTMIRAKLHSNEPSAVKATELTILLLIGMTEHLLCVFKQSEAEVSS